MKMYWGRRLKGEISKELAIGCLATNLAVPGAGTILAGRPVSGSIQAIIGLTGMALSIFYGVPLLNWTIANWGRIHDPTSDPSEVLIEMMSVILWPAAGVLLFAFALLWSAGTMYFIILQIQRREPPPAQAPRK